jgi:hypothetical protein
MSIFDHFATDSKAEAEGKWFGLTANGSIKLAALTSPRAEQARREAERQYASYLRLKTGVPPEIASKIALHTIAHGCVVDWQGSDWVDDSGEALECTPENVMMLFEALPKLRDLISNILTDDDSFKVEKREEAAGNSKKR